MLDGADPSLLYEWQAFYERNPFGDERADIRAAMIATTVANAAGKKKGGGTFRLQDFMLDFGKRKPSEDSIERARAFLKARYGKQS